jgi:hypothetical protein
VLGDDHVLDAVVGLLGDDALADELVLRGEGAGVEDALGVGVADAGKALELVGIGGIDVDEGGGGGRCRRLGSALGGGGEDGGENKGRGEECVAKLEHGVGLLGSC